MVQKPIFPQKKFPPLDFVVIIPTVPVGRPEPVSAFEGGRPGEFSLLYPSSVLRLDVGRWLPSGSTRVRKARLPCPLLARSWNLVSSWDVAVLSRESPVPLPQANSRLRDTGIEWLNSRKASLHGIPGSHSARLVRDDQPGGRQYAD